MKGEFNRAWFLHPRWKEANQACKHATGGMGLYDAWEHHRGCSSIGTRGWLTYANVAEAIAALMFGYEPWEWEVTA